MDDPEGVFPLVTSEGGAQRVRDGAHGWEWPNPFSGDETLPRVRVYVD
jgi:hypothetical protein